MESFSSRMYYCLKNIKKLLHADIRDFESSVQATIASSLNINHLCLNENSQLNLNVIRHQV